MSRRHGILAGVAVVPLLALLTAPSLRVAHAQAAPQIFIEGPASLPPQAPPPSAPVAPAPPPQPADATPSAAEATPPPPRPLRAPSEIRLGGVIQSWNHGALQASSLGGMGVVSVELPYGLQKMLFEGGLGAMGSNVPGSERLLYYVVDFQTCLIDVPFWDSGVSVLGCLRLAGGTFDTWDTYGKETGGALWIGAGARVRWQTKLPLFFEVHFNAVYGTVSAGESNNPGWVDIGGTAGLRL